MGQRHHRGRETKFGPPQTAPNKQKRKGKSGHCASMLHGSPVVTDRGRRLTAAAPQVARTTAASLFHRTISCVRVRRKSLREEHLEKRNRSGAHWLRPSWLLSCPGHSRFAALSVLLLGNIAVATLSSLATTPLHHYKADISSYHQVYRRLDIGI